MSHAKPAKDFRSKKSDAKSSISVVVLGDEKVGKSSLISTFVFRHFSEVVPGIMTRVQLPPDPSTTFAIGGDGKKKGTSCVTTIVDTREGDKSFISTSSVSTIHLKNNQQPIQSSVASSKSRNVVPTFNIENVDSIVLVYDVDRVETFERLESHWLPLIEECYNGDVPVVIAGNKMDLQLSNSTDEQSQARSRHKIVSLLQRFKFVRQCIKCSAKNLLNVNDVFVKAQHAVIYPINPLYDLSAGTLTPACKHAFTRIFRMFDEDGDGLLSNRELQRFQSYCFRVSLMEGDLAGWKKVLSKSNPAEAVVEDGKFTVFGFMAIFDVFINSDRLEIPWIILRIFGYKDDLTLQVPTSISADDAWRLNIQTIIFLTRTFHQYSSNDGFLMPKDIASIFSIVTDTALPPWHPDRAGEFTKDCFSSPVITLSKFSITNHENGDINDDVTIPKMSLRDWIGYWHMICSIAPSSTKVELYQLGYNDDSKLWNKNKIHPSLSSKSNMVPKSLVRGVVIGSKGCGKSAFLSCLSNLDEIDCGVTVNAKNDFTSSPGTTFMHASFTDKTFRAQRILSRGLALTEVPYFEEGKKMESDLMRLLYNSKDLSQGFDFVILIFDSQNLSSLNYVLDIEKRLLKDNSIPRMFVGTKYEKKDGNTEFDTDEIIATREKSIEHCENLDLESPIFVCTQADPLDSIGDSIISCREKIIEHMVRCSVGTSDPNGIRSRPYEERLRKEAEKRRQTIWLAGILGAGVATFIGVRLLIGQQQKREGKMQFLSNLFLFGALSSISQSGTAKTEV